MAMFDVGTKNRSRFRNGCLVALLALVADQVTKQFVLTFPQRFAEGIPVFPGFHLVLGMNSGVSFGMLGSMPWWGLSLFGLAIVVGMFVWMWREDSRLATLGIGLIIGGALGNIIDRARHGAVVDFLDFWIGTYHWPTFNVADIAIVSGVVGTLSAEVLRGRSSTRSQDIG